MELFCTSGWPTHVRELKVDKVLPSIEKRNINLDTCRTTQYQAQKGTHNRWTLLTSAHTFTWHSDVSLHS